MGFRTLPVAELVEQVLPPAAGRVDGNREPLASWLRVWDWSPVLPTRLLTDWKPVMTALRRLIPEGPGDPRTVAELEPATSFALEAEELVEWAAEHGRSRLPRGSLRPMTSTTPGTSCSCTNSSPPTRPPGRWTCLRSSRRFRGRNSPRSTSRSRAVA
ncbi:hypothetical protein ACWGJT_20610 [Streptomyces xantholiticus]